MKRLSFAIFFSVIIIFICGGPASAQQFSCDNLLKIINVVAIDTTLKTIKGHNVDNDENDFYALITLWNENDDVHSQDVLYSTAQRKFHYYAEYLNSGDGKKEFAGIVSEMQTCLGSKWTAKPITGYAGKAFRYKNADNRVAITLANDSGVIKIDIYYDTR